MQKIELNAQPRTVLGRKVKRVRASGFVPAVLYGKGQESLSLQVPLKEFEKVFKAAGESTLVYVNVDGTSFPTIIHEVARDRVSGRLIHADFFKVRLDEKIKADIPVVFTGVSLAVKDLGGVFVRNVNELEVEAFPQDLPHEISLDISKLVQFGDQIFVKDIDLGPDVKVLAHAEDIIATIQKPMSEEEFKASLEEPTKGVEEVEVIEKEKKEEVSAEEGAASAPTQPAPEKKEKKEK